MIKNLIISFFLLTFAQGIAGSHDPVTREKLIPPFPFNEDKIIERVSEMPRKLTREEVINRFKEKHGESYCYDLVEYKDAHTKVIIVCNNCGLHFEQRPYSHFNGAGCPHCSVEKQHEKLRLPLSTWIERSLKNHKIEYDYSLVCFKSLFDKVWIGCPFHGWFQQEAKSHMDGQCCPDCVGKHRWTQEEFIKECQKKFGDRYSYDKVVFVTMTTNVIITCKKHGDFEVTPYHFLHGEGCKTCTRENIGIKQRSNTESFVEKAKKVHGDKYDYSKVKYIKKNIPVEIVCKKHNSFWQTPNNHLCGAGCPHCLRSLGEERISDFLKQNNIPFVSQKTFKNDNDICENLKFRVDFYIASENVIIEYNGQQHYQKDHFFSSSRSYEKQIKRDSSLRKFCKDHSIHLIEIPYWEYEKINSILEKELKTEQI